MAGKKERDQGMPNAIFIGPLGRHRNRTKYLQVLFLIEEKDADGKPLKLKLLYPDSKKIEVKEGMKFMTGYVPAIMLES